MNREQIELKPCPFCGGEARFAICPTEITIESGKKIENPNAGGEYIECVSNTCGMESMLIFSTMADAKPLLAEIWNRRALAQPGAEPKRKKIVITDLGPSDKAYQEGYRDGKAAASPSPERVRELTDKALLKAYDKYGTRDATRDAIIWAINAALAERGAGWVAVPEEPTEEMMRVGSLKLEDCERADVLSVTSLGAARDSYKAMLAARPKG